MILRIFSNNSNVSALDLHHQTLSAARTKHEIVLKYYFVKYFLSSGPSEPIVEVVKPIRRGLNISWRTDVTSRQDKYIVVYTRNDTRQSVNIETTDKVAQLRELYPGAQYKIQVLAVSHGLQSTPHTTFTAVLPNPPTNLKIVKVEADTVTLAWTPPANSLFTDYRISYRPIDEDSGTAPRAWTGVTDVPLNATSFVLKDLPSGEYLLKS